MLKITGQYLSRIVGVQIEFVDIDRYVRVVHEVCNPYGHICAEPNGIVGQVGVRWPAVVGVDLTTRGIPVGTKDALQTSRRAIRTTDGIVRVPIVLRVGCRYSCRPVRRTVYIFERLTRSPYLI